MCRHPGPEWLEGMTCSCFRAQSLKYGLVLGLVVYIGSLVYCKVSAAGCSLRRIVPVSGAL